MRGWTVLVALVVAVVSGCQRAPARARERARPSGATAVYGQCTGCQELAGNGCVRVLGAAADQVGVTIARVCDPWCCPGGALAYVDASQTMYLGTSSSGRCPAWTNASFVDDAPAAIRGVVTEGSGWALVAGATVVLTHGDMEAASTISDAGGRFAFDGLSPGHYTLTVYWGDAVFKKDCIAVSARDELHVDVPLDAKLASGFVLVD